ncbi:ribonuclease H-like domain-containing protein [Pseudoneobacillus sp. C159]
MSLKNKLNRFRPHLNGTNEKLVEKVIQPKAKIPYLEEWMGEGVLPYHVDQDYCLIRKVCYPLSYVHGHYPLADFLLAVKLWNDLEMNHPLSAKGFLPNQLFFFDTETTGLGGGAGNRIFILGHAALVENEIILKQHILPHPGAEIAFLKSFLEEVDYQTLVTYNGKSFDWPQVKSQHTLIREHVPKLPEFGHFDLYHAAKRIWKYRLERMKLSVVENEVLGVTRTDDIPGHLAPIIFFDFVERQNPEGMFKILKHNEMDILSLITLYSHLTFQILGVDRNQTMQEKFLVGNWFTALGDIEQAKKIYHHIDDEDSRVYVESQLNLGYLYKKQKQFDISLPFFDNVIKQSSYPFLRLEACIETAKILEHRTKEYEKAIGYCDIALDIVLQGWIHRRYGLHDIKRRRERIIRKNNFLGKRKIHEESSK